MLCWSIYIIRYKPSTKLIQKETVDDSSTIINCLQKSTTYEGFLIWFLHANGPQPILEYLGALALSLFRRLAAWRKVEYGVAKINLHLLTLTFIQMDLLVLW